MSVSYRRTGWPGHISPGPNPYDLLSAALAACTAMTVCFEARRKQLPLKRVEVGRELSSRRPG
ncbi:OsmC family protein [Bradyrhizobium sp. CIR48]|uniref:OsmC family protein n=1 Tax=Bradyrhizobium sp. CIR48 TaxID=2663840 RepID=UPI0016068882|nr:OsmC family protein [Bradyrhizobium sp. CIR48]